MEFLTSLATALTVGLTVIGSWFGIVPDSQPVTEQPISLGAFNPSGGGTYRLQSSIGVSNTSIRLSSFKEPISNIPYTMTYLNSAIGYGTLDPQSPTRSEFVSFTGITQNSDGTATLTGVTRGLSRSFPYTASTTLAVPHPAQSIFILSDSPQLFTEYAVKQNDETVTGSWSFPYPTASTSPATRGFVLATLAGTSTLSFDKTVVAGTAGETLSAGQFVYLNPLDARWYKIATTSASSTPISINGIAQGAGVAAGNISGGVLIKGLDTNQTGLSAGVTYFSSTTVAGAIGRATTTHLVGKARTTTSIYFDPYFLAKTDNAVSITATTGIRVFTATTSAQSFSIPSGIRFLYVTVVGGGGGGSAASPGTGGAGGAGAYCDGIIDLSTVAATTTLGITVGGYGAGGASGGDNAGTAGASSTVSTFILAGGGGGGGTSAGGALGGTAGQCSGAVSNMLEIENIVGTAGSTTAGNVLVFGGSNPLGQGAVSRANQIGLPALGYGSGGAPSDRSSLFAGGIGSSGIVIIKY